MKLRGRNKVSPNFSMSSMTDIVFLLLVFFLLTSPAIRPEALDLLLPSANGKTVKTKNTSVSINTRSQYFIDGKRIKESQLEKKLQTTLGNVQNPTIVLKAAQGVAIEKAVKVMDIANKNKYKIVLAVKPE